MKHALKTALSAAALTGMLAVSAGAQNTDDDWKWVVDFSSRYDGWDTACDRHKEREEQRCYVRYVDVYAPRPQFGAAFAFVQWGEDRRPSVDFSFERGTRFRDGGFAVTEGDGNVWALDTARCAANRCELTGDEADALFAALTPGRDLTLRFADRYGRIWERQWPAGGFAAALADFRAQSVARGLPGS